MLWQKKKDISLRQMCDGLTCQHDIAIRGLGIKVSCDKRDSRYITESRLLPQWRLPANSTKLSARISGKDVRIRSYGFDVVWLLVTADNLSNP
jgi:hypothetical protein